MEYELVASKDLLLAQTTTTLIPMEIVLSMLAIFMMIMMAF